MALDFKGGPFKGRNTFLKTQGEKYEFLLFTLSAFSALPHSGFFHVPRCLYMCEQLLDELLLPSDRP